MSSNVPDIRPLPSIQTAVIQDPYGAPAVIDSLPLPPLLPGTVLVRTVAVALNPCDYKMGTSFPTPGAIIGNDFAGIVVAIDTQTETVFRIGDRVCGLVHGSNPADTSNGAFAQYVRAHVDLLLRIPEGLPIEQASTLGLGLATNCLALWEGGLRLEFNPENVAEEPMPVLVYGGSTATGTLATQLLRLSGLNVIATCSQHRFDLLHQYGASAVFDYTDPEVAARIREYTRGGLRHALDCITDPESVACCYSSIGRTGGRYAHLESCPAELRTRRTVKAEFPIALEVFGKHVQLSGDYERSPNREKHEVAVRWFAMFQRLLDANKLKAHPTQVIPGGFNGVIDGIRLLRSGSISGVKLVVFT